MTKILPPAKIWIMILYLEKQLDEAYNVYMRNSMKQGKEYMSKEKFRTMFEELMEVVYEHD